MNDPEWWVKFCVGQGKMRSFYQKTSFMEKDIADIKTVNLFI